VQEGAEPLLLKLDVEGEERRLVPGIAALLPKVCALFFETHHGVEGWDEVTAPLSRVGFCIRLLRRRGSFCDGFAVRT